MIITLTKPEMDKLMNEQGGLFKINPTHKGNADYIGSIGDDDYFVSAQSDNVLHGRL